MKKQRLLEMIPLLSAGAGMLFPSAISAKVPPADVGQKPHVVFILTDQQTASAMSCMGNPHVKTPAMDMLARDGVTFTRAYCPFPLSGPSRASLMTGRMACEVGITDNGQPAGKGVMEENIGKKMQQAGYNTLYAGKWHIPEIEIPSGIGFTKISGMNDPSLVENCKAHLNQKHDNPVFLVVSFLNPHEICEYARDETLPYGPLAAFDTQDCPNLPANFMPSTYEAEAIRLHEKANPRTMHPTDSFTSDHWRRYMYAYYRLVERVDAEMGRLLDLLKKTGMYDNSLIIFSSDHGDGVAAHQWNQKWVLFEEVVNIPLIVKAPHGRGLQNIKNSTALSNIGLDIFSTICDYGGAGLDAGYRGKSYRPIIEGASDRLHSEVFIETTLAGIDTRAWSVVEGKYKYVLYRFFQNREQLYDLEADPGEMLNLAVDKTYEMELKRLRNKMYRHGQTTGDGQLLRALGPLEK